MSNKQYRNEWKYIVTNEYLAIIESRLKTVLQLDENAANDGKYEVHSLILMIFMTLVCETIIMAHLKNLNIESGITAAIPNLCA